MNTLAFLNSNSNAKYLLNNANSSSNTNNIKNDLMPTLFNDEFKSTFDDIQLNDNQLKQLLQLKQHEKLMQHINSQQDDYQTYHHNQNQLIDLNNNNFDALNLNALKSLNESNPQFANNLQYASNKNDKKLFDLLNRLNPKQSQQISLHDLQQQQQNQNLNLNHNDNNYLNNDNSNPNLFNLKLKLLQQQQLLQLQNMQHNNSNSNNNLEQYQLTSESLNNLNKLASINNIKSLNGFMDKNSMHSNEDMLDNKYRHANPNQQDLIRKLLEKKKQQELNIISYQQQKQFQQLQSKILNHQQYQQQQAQQQQQLQQQYEPVSKEYILSQLKAQKKLQAQIQQQKLQLQHQQQHQQQQQMIESQNEMNNNARINLMHLFSMNSGNQNDANKNNNNNSSDGSAFGAFNENLKAIVNNQYLFQQQIQQQQQLEQEQQQQQQQQQLQQQQKKQPKKMDPIEKLKQLLIENNNLNQQSNSNSRLASDKSLIDSVSMTKDLVDQHSLEKIEQTDMNERKSSNSHHLAAQQTTGLDSLNDLPKSQVKQSKIEINSEGFIKNIPPNMLVDQYGMLGLTMMLNHKEKNNELDDNISLILGKGDLAKSLVQQSSDLLNSNKDGQSESIFFGLIPNSENVEQAQAKAEKTDKDSQSDDKGGMTYHLSPASQKSNPYEFAVSGIRDKLMDINELIKNSNDDLLFYLFYFVCKDEIQAKAFHLLSARNWIYNQELKLWIKSVKGKDASDSNEHATTQHYMFDVELWEIKKMN